MPPESATGPVRVTTLARTNGIRGKRSVLQSAPIHDSSSAASPRQPASASGVGAIRDKQNKQKDRADVVSMGQGCWLVLRGETRAGYLDSAFAFPSRVVSFIRNERSAGRVATGPFAGRVARSWVFPAYRGGTGAKKARRVYGNRDGDERC